MILAGVCSPGWRKPPSTPTGCSAGAALTSPGPTTRHRRALTAADNGDSPALVQDHSTPDDRPPLIDDLLNGRPLTDARA